MEIAENEENNSTNPVNTAHNCIVVYIVYTRCIFLYTICFLRTQFSWNRF